MVRRPYPCRALALTELLALGAALLLPAAGPAQITLGQKDTFETGTTLNWANGMAPGALAVLAGGPAGANDHYLSVTANGSLGAAGRITVFNRVQWLGDYNTAGVNAIEMNLLNPNTDPLPIRIGLKVDTSNGSPGYASTTGFSVPADGQWH